MSCSICFLSFSFSVRSFATSSASCARVAGVNRTNSAVSAPKITTFCIGHLRKSRTITGHALTWRDGECVEGQTTLTNARQETARGVAPFATATSIQLPAPDFFRFLNWVYRGPIIKPQEPPEITRRDSRGTARPPVEKPSANVLRALAFGACRAILGEIVKEPIEPG